MDRCALFVDAGYVLADGAMAAHGTGNREAASWDYPGLLQFFAGLATDRTGLPLLRCYWYEASVDGRRTPGHDMLADLPGLTLRLARRRPGKREGVETEIHRDLTTLARNRAVGDVLLVSAEEGLAPVIADVQDLGVRVIIVHIAVDGNWTVSRALRQQCDDLVEIQGAQLRAYAEPSSGADVPGYTEQYAASLGGGRSVSNGHATGPAAGARQAQPASPAGAHPGPPAIYTAPVVAEYQPSAPAPASPRQPEPAPVLENPPSGPQARGPRESHVPAAPAAQGQASPGRDASAAALPDQRAAGPRSPYETPPSPGSFVGPVAAQFSPAPEEQFSPAPTEQFSPAPTGQFSPAPAEQYSPGAAEQFSPAPAEQLPPAAAGQFYRAPAEQFSPAPAEQFPPAAAEQFSSATPSLPSRRGPQGQGPQGQGPPGQHGPQPARPQQAPRGQQVHRPAAAASAGYVPQQAPYSAPSPAGPSAASMADTVQAAHAEGVEFGESVAREAPALWLEAVLARKPRMPTDLEARLLQGSALPIDSLLHDEVRQALRDGFWDALERSRR